MNRLLRGFFDNNSVFGQLMTRCGILIAANLMFVLFSLPVVTIGASWAALHYTMLKTLREKELNPFRTFWEGFRTNLKQATAAWLVLLALAVVLVLELFWCGQFTGPVAYFRYGLLVLLILEIVIGIYLFPTMAAFRATLPQLLQDSVYFAVRRPVTLVLLAAAHILPMALTYVDYVRLPLYAFLWCTFGFAAVAMFSANELLKQFSAYLAPAEDPDAPDGSPQKSEAEILEEMKKLGM